MATSQVFIVVNQETLRNFRAECIRRRTTPTKELAHLMQQRLKEWTQPRSTSHPASQDDRSGTSHIVIAVNRETLRIFRAECIRRGTTPAKELAHLMTQRLKAWTPEEHDDAGTRHLSLERWAQTRRHPPRD